MRAEAVSVPDVRDGARGQTRTLLHEGGFGVTPTDHGAFVFTPPDGCGIPDSDTLRMKTESRRFRGIVGADPSDLAAGF